MALTAGCLALEKRGQCLAKGIDFAVETTLAGAGVLALMKQAKARRFEIRLMYVALKNADLSIQRVREGTALGGHFVPPDDVRRRYDRSLANAPAGDTYRGFERCLRQLATWSPQNLGSAARRRPLERANLPDWTRRVLFDLESSKAQQA